MPKARGQFAEFPYLDYPLHALGSSPRGTSAGSGYGYSIFFLFPFSRIPGLNETNVRPLFPRLVKISSQRYSLDLSWLAHTMVCVRLARNVSKEACVATHN